VEGVKVGRNQCMWGYMLEDANMLVAIGNTEGWLFKSEVYQIRWNYQLMSFGCK